MEIVKLETGVSITVFDHPSVSDKIQKSPEDYGLSELSIACQSTWQKCCRLRKIQISTISGMNGITAVLCMKYMEMKCML